ncbi:unnamed protein product [Diatraea saccharalis]|uniref:Carboxylesterase type B domain-containing protein n=1 Tax=Diatraea saccharalis TaxID=40085 RepID=A0A9N9WJW3_9NEOP|nr:unnamed protein product [Diatraea saccharalis]
MLIKVSKYFILTIFFTIINADKPIVDTTHGKIQGKTLQTLLKRMDYYGFMGIPFAKPPIKDLRFLPPQPIEPWDHLLIATKEKQACIQFNNNVLKGQPLGQYGSEDCLYLDIFTPKTDEKKRAVIVFLYNEHFMGSYNKTKDYSPDFFIEEDVIIVTVSHRLSVFGFLSLEDDIVPGNAGLKDIVTALEWTKNNIYKFGGDPDKITLMGCQGGAVAVDLLIHSKSKRLFHSAILQSETSWSSIYLQDNVRERAIKLSELLDWKSNSNSILLKSLNEVPVSNILLKVHHANTQDYFKENQRSSVTFSPIVEKQPDGLITGYPEDSSEKIDIPIMIGLNSREGLHPAVEYLLEPRYLSFVEKDFPFLIPIRTGFRFNPLHDSFYEAVDEIKKFYYKKGKVTVRSVNDHITYLGDALVGYAVDRAVKFYAERTSNSLFYYYFDYYSNLNENKNNLMKLSTLSEGTWGAAAGDELCYLFYCPDLKQQYLKNNQSMSEEFIIQRKLIKLWTNFAKYGNPTPVGDATLEGLNWPVYNKNTKKYLNVGKLIEVKSELLKERFSFWDEFLIKWEKEVRNIQILRAIDDEL